MDKNDIRLYWEKQLSPKFVTQLEKVKEQAKADHFLGEEIVDRDQDKIQRRVIVNTYPDEVIGFFTPSSMTYKGVKHWRAGVLYLAPASRGNGIMERVLSEYFNKSRPGLVWIDNENTKSINLFTKLGFVKDKQKDIGAEKGFWYVLPKKSSNGKKELLNW